MNAAAIHQIAGVLRDARRVLFITGAGLSADSGLPTYRGVGGLYNDADTDDGVPIEVALSGQMFRNRPEVTWKYILQIEEAGRGHVPNAGHRAIAAAEADRHVCVLTQNVDGFHRQAGSTNVIDIHGDVHDLYCTTCEWQRVVEDYAAFDTVPPRCPECSGVVRPDVVLFGEMLPGKKIRALEAEIGAGFDLVFSVGTSSLFPYIAEPVFLAARQGIPTVEINPSRSEVSGVVTYKLAAGAADSLSAIIAAL